MKLRKTQAVASWGGPSEPPESVLTGGSGQPPGLSQPQVSTRTSTPVQAAVTLGAAAWPHCPGTEDLSAHTSLAASTALRGNSCRPDSVRVLAGQGTTCWQVDPTPAQSRVGFSLDPRGPQLASLALPLSLRWGTRPGAPEFLGETQVTLAGRGSCRTGGGCSRPGQACWGVHAHGLLMETGVRVWAMGQWEPSGGRGRHCSWGFPGNWAGGSRREGGQA